MSTTGGFGKEKIEKIITYGGWLRNPAPPNGWLKP